ncbi:tRNA lysidine(34) synthetase TilS [Candidatus Saccharibacteria bacterium]|nr:tRNA lysidine(34) synthetase TilS [Candidatus Saccharibacteria bacterium]
MNKTVLLPAPGRYVLAVSGGVDSVALLDMVARQAELSKTGQYQLIVAHFDHGIRADSAGDAVFVAELAKKYGLLFESQREELGVLASEELARTRRYKFLRAVAQQHTASLVTAHHADDSIETIAINLVRGTGWRGLAVLDSDIIRPLLDLSKQDILAYASTYQLAWREDSTNDSDAYLRNRIRHQMGELTTDSSQQLLSLRVQQITLKHQIDEEVYRVVGAGPSYSRYFFTHLGDATATECLRHATHARLTRPQLAQALLAIKTARPGATYQAGGGVQFLFTSRNFEVELIK